MLVHLDFCAFFCVSTFAFYDFVVSQVVQSSGIAPSKVLVSLFGMFLAFVPIFFGRKRFFEDFFFSFIVFFT